MYWFIPFQGSSKGGFSGDFKGNLKVSVAGVDLKEDSALKHSDAAGDILESKAEGAVVELFKFGLNNAGAIVVNPEVHVVAVVVLGKVYETSIAVFHDIVHKFLDDAEHQQFLIHLQPYPVIVKAGAGIETAAAADLLEEVGGGAFQPEILKGGRHEAMADIADKQYGFINDLFGTIDTL